MPGTGPVRTTAAAMKGGFCEGLFCGRRRLPVQIGSGPAFIRSMLKRLLTLRSGTAPISLR
jgi:hypothetical protein